MSVDIFLFVSLSASFLLFQMDASERMTTGEPIPLHLVREFLEDGVVVIPNVLDAETIQKARASFHASLKDNYDVDVSDLRNSSTALSKLSTTGGAGGEDLSKIYLGV